MKSLWMVLIIGIILRIFLSFSTFHPDVLAFKFGGDLIASGKILNLYDYSDPKVAVLNYPPLIYWFHGLFNLLLSPLLSSGLLVKVPYLIFDLLIGFILLKLFDTERQAKLAFSLWIFNPVNLYATYMMGQFDIIPAFFIVLSIYFAVKEKLNFAAISLGFGIAFKLSPIFLIVPLLIFGKNYWGKLKLFVLCLIPYLISIIPYLPSHKFRATALFANQSSKSLYANIPISGGESIILFPALLLFFYLIIWHSKVKIDIWKLYLMPLLLFFIFTHYHPQWLIWVTPLLIMDLVISGFKNILPHLVIFISWFVSLFFFDPSLTIGIFAPVAPVLRSMPSIWVLLDINTDFNLLRSLVQTTFAAAAFYQIYRCFTVEQNNETI